MEAAYLDTRHKEHGYREAHQVLIDACKCVESNFLTSDLDTADNLSSCAGQCIPWFGISLEHRLKLENMM